jgi:hypothetical protein
VARGWESKSVEAQQQDASQQKMRGRAPTAEELTRRERRRTLELARTRTQHDLSRASASAHRRMLQEAIADLDRQIAKLG